MRQLTTPMNKLQARSETQDDTAGKCLEALSLRNVGREQGRLNHGGHHRRPDKSIGPGISNDCFLVRDSAWLGPSKLHLKYRFLRGVMRGAVL